MINNQNVCYRYGKFYLYIVLLLGAPSGDLIITLHMVEKPDRKESMIHRYDRVIKRRTQSNAGVSSSGTDQPPPSISGSSESSMCSVNKVCMQIVVRIQPVYVK